MESSEAVDDSIAFSSIHLDPLIWTEKTIKQSSNIYDEQQSQPSSKKLSIPQNSYKKNLSQLKPHINDFIYTHVKPDYGSLGQFITDINLNTDLLRQKKKKNQGQDEMQEKKIRAQFKNKNINTVLNNPNCTNLERGVACKMLIEDSFKEAFGVSISNFNAQNQKQDLQDKKPLNLYALSESLDEIMDKNSRQKQQQINNGLNLMKDLFRKRSFLRDLAEQAQDRNKVIQKICDAKQSYKSLAKVQMPVSCQTYQSLIIKYASIDAPKQISQSSRCIIQENAENNEMPCFQVNSQKFVINNISEHLSSQTLLFALSHVNLQILEKISIRNTHISIDFIFLLIDLMIKNGKHLKHFCLDDLKMDRSFEKLSSKVKNLLQVLPLQRLVLNSMHMQTKQFCIICLGIGVNRTLKSVQLKHNKIDQRARKSYQVIMRFFKNIVINLSGNQIEAQLEKRIPIRKLTANRPRTFKQVQ